MDSSFRLATINLERSIVYNKGSQVTISIYFFFLSLKIVFVLANSVDSDKMLHNVAFHLSLHSVAKYVFRSQ